MAISNQPNKRSYNSNLTQSLTNRAVFCGRPKTHFFPEYSLETFTGVKESRFQNAEIFVANARIECSASYPTFRFSRIEDEGQRRNFRGPLFIPTANCPAEGRLEGAQDGHFFRTAIRRGEGRSQKEIEIRSRR